MPDGRDDAAVLACGAAIGFGAAAAVLIAVVAAVMALTPVGPAVVVVLIWLFVAASADGSLPDVPGWFEVAAVVGVGAVLLLPVAAMSLLVWRAVRGRRMRP